VLAVSIGILKNESILGLDFRLEVVHLLLIPAGTRERERSEGNNHEMNLNVKMTYLL
jgi:hypothetical protein